MPETLTGLIEKERKREAGRNRPIRLGTLFDRFSSFRTFGIS
jgi:hypothetical protein